MPVHQTNPATAYIAVFDGLVNSTIGCTRPQQWNNWFADTLGMGRQKLLVSLSYGDTIYAVLRSNHRARDRPRCTRV